LLIADFYSNFWQIKITKRRKVKKGYKSVKVFLWLHPGLPIHNIGCNGGVQKKSEGENYVCPISQGKF